MGIETSCDETAAAVVADGRYIKSSVVASQVQLHERFGGVVPEIASRAHVEAINTVIDKALGESAVRPEQIAAVAVTNEPGLIGSLLVGLMTAKTIALAWDVPLIAVNHIYAHAYAAALNDEEVLDLAFVPGLTTSPTVTELSGRGFGMDIVRAKLAQLDGTVHIDSQLGQGTVTTLRVPKRLASTLPRSMRR